MKFLTKLIFIISLWLGSLFLGDYAFYLGHGYSIGQCQLNGKCQ